MSVYYRRKLNLGIIEFDLEDSKVNLLTSEAMQRLDAILDQIPKDSWAKAVVLTSRKTDVFIAGADIKEIEGINDPRSGEEKSRLGQKVLDKLEDLKVPTIAVIDGVALGGGCELALACRYRIATFSDKVKIGLPEVNLGIIPGFGGTYRLPRLVGLIQSLKLITSGKPVSGQQAFKIGLIDRLYPQINLDHHLKAFVEDVLNDRRKRRLKKTKGIQGVLERNSLGQAIILSQARKKVGQLTKGFYPAPLKAIEVLKRTRSLNRKQALGIEAKVFSELAVTGISKNLIQLFYLSEKYRKLVPKEAENINPTFIKKSGVLGAGIMGGGIAQILAYYDIRVRMKDVQYNAIAQGLRTASKIFFQAVKKRRLTKSQARRKINHISGALDYTGFKQADIIIEAVVEDMHVKKKVLKEISQVVAPDTIICSNTSALSITEMSKSVADPSKVVGLHFFNPVHRMPLIEIVKTDQTSVETIAAALSLVKRLKKTPILVHDSAGFLVNRILLAYLNEAGHILEEGGTIEDIDSVILNFGLPMGPFALSDEVGLDVGIKVLTILEESFGERFAPVNIFKKVYDHGLLGKKSGKGFYIHTGQRSPNREVYNFISNPPRQRSQDGEALERMIYVMINEAARCLEERVVVDPGAVDIGMVMGTGFPPFRGGLLWYADHIGVAKICSQLEFFQEKFQSDRFRPCSYLLNLKEQKKGFYDGLEKNRS